MTRLRLRAPEDREIAALALPALGALAADPIVSLIDTAWVGRLGAAPLGALGVASAVFAVAFFIFNFLAYGTTPLVAGAEGRRDRAAAQRIVAMALRVAVVGGIAGVLVLEAATGPILDLMGAGPEVIDDATAYLRIRALSIPAVLIVLVGHGAFRGRHDTKTPLVVTLAINAVNLVLDPILIFGAGLDVAGAAVATVVAQWLGAAWFVVLLRRRFGVALRTPIVSAELRSFLNAGRDLAIRTGALLTVITLSTAVAARISTTAVAAHQVVLQIWVFLALVVDALAIAAQAMVGRRLGAADGAAARRVSNRLLELGFLVGIVAGAVIAALYGVLPGFFTNDAAVEQAIRGVYWFVVITQPLNALVFVWDGVVIGAADFRFLAVAMVLSGVAAVAVLLSVLPLEAGLAGVWWGMVVLMVGRLASMVWWHRSLRAFRFAPAGA